MSNLKKGQIVKISMVNTIEIDNHTTTEELLRQINDGEFIFEGPDSIEIRDAKNKLLDKDE
jgi:hypothetical protein